MMARITSWFCVVSIVTGIFANESDIKFSDSHGPKITLHDNKTVARRYEGYCYSVAFSDRPLHLNETLRFNITEIEMGWLSNLNVGIIYTDPDSISDLVLCDANVSVSLPHTKVFIFNRFYSPDNIYQFRVDHNGVAYLSPNVSADDVVFSGVDVTKKFWAIFNIFGDSKAVKILGTTADKVEDEQYDSWTTWLYKLLL